MDLPAPFGVRVEPDRTVVRVVPSGELDVANCGLLAARLDELWNSGWTNVVVDLRELTFMDASGVHLLLEHRRRASQTGARFSLMQGPPCVARVLELCGVHEVFPYTQPARAA